jgi:hypothetical protein
MSTSFDTARVASLLLLAGSELSCGTGLVARSPVRSEGASGGALGRARIEPTDLRAEGLSEAGAGANKLMSISFDIVCVASLLLLLAATGACGVFSAMGHKRLIA